MEQEVDRSQWETEWWERSGDASSPTTEREEYASKLSEWYRRITVDLIRLHEYETAIARAFVLTFDLLNSGRSPARRVKVELFFPLGISVNEDRDHREPRDAPAPPASIEDEIASLFRAREIDDTTWYGDWTKRPLTLALNGSTLVRDRGAKDRQTFWAWMVNLEHGQSQRLNSLLLTFEYNPSFDLIIPYKIHASNQPQDSTGEIRVAIYNEPQPPSEIPVHRM